MKYNPKTNSEECKRLLATPARLLTGLERQARTILAIHMTPMPCPMCFAQVSVYDAGDETCGEMEKLYDGKYVCPGCDTELAKVVPFVAQPGTPGWHWRRKDPIPIKGTGGDGGA